MPADSRKRWIAVTAMLCLSMFVTVGVTADSIINKDGRRQGSFNNLNGTPAQAIEFSLKVFDPGLFSTVCADPAGADSSDAPVCRDLRGGFDHVAAGVGLRDTGSGTIRLQGAPSGAAVVAAQLFWAVIADDDTANGDTGASMDVFFEGHRVTGERVAQVEEMCWETTGFSVHYSADVTRLVPDVINGNYRISGMPSSVTDGHDSGKDPENAPLPWAQGASLNVVYDHADAALDRRVSIHVGGALLTSSVDLILPLSPPLSADGTVVVRHTRIGGDGQTRDGEPLPPFATFLGSDWQGGDEVQIRGPGSPIDTSSDWQGQDGAPRPGLWDTQSDELWHPLSPVDPNNYSLRWVAVTGTSGEEATAPQVPLKTEAPPLPPPGDPVGQVYDCVYVAAVVMTTSG